MEIFRDNDKLYLDWTAENPDGYVINCRRNPTEKYLILHASSCHKISTSDDKKDKNQFTGGSYIKVCASREDEIKVWIESIFGAVVPKRCSYCEPIFSESNTELDRLADDDLGSTHPHAVLVETLVYSRSQAVVAAVLLRANGVCERCKIPAPFNRKSTGDPYLEVHHTVQLSKGGPDTFENAEGLCPNCHREAHFG